MATTATGGNLMSLPAPRTAQAGSDSVVVRAARRRKVSAEAGRAMEMLGHAVEYLADEFSLECMTRQNDIAAGMHPRVVAIEILKKCSRVVYLSCPEVPTLGERLGRLVGRRA